MMCFNRQTGNVMYFVSFNEVEQSIEDKHKIEERRIANEERSKIEDEENTKRKEKRAANREIYASVNNAALEKVLKAIREAFTEHMEARKKVDSGDIPTPSEEKFLEAAKGVLFNVFRLPILNENSAPDGWYQIYEGKRDR